jgi:transcriptional regulator
MVAENSQFERYDASDLRALITDYPLAWVCARGNAMEASSLPVIGEYDADGKLVGLIGHMAKANPLHDSLRQDPNAVILFNGPGGYVSPEHAGLRDWAPTWNFAQARIAVTMRLDDALTTESLDVLIDAMERDRAAPWRSAEMGSRYHAMAGAIIGFRAAIDHVHARFKLGQDENDDVLARILARHTDAALVRWMRRFNAGRG